MWPKELQMDMWSNGPAMLIQHKMSKKHVPQEDDKNCQENINRRQVKSKMCTDKNCQATKCSKKVGKRCQTTNMCPVKSQMDVQLPKPAVLYHYRRLSKDKNCQATICEYNDSKSQSTVSMCSDKNGQENEIINLWPEMPEVNVWLPKPAIRRLCSEKNCQSTRCYKKKNYNKYCKSV